MHNNAELKIIAIAHCVTAGFLLRDADALMRDLRRLSDAFLTLPHDTAPLAEPADIPVPQNPYIELLEICKEFCSRVEAGEVRSVRTYNAMKSAIARIESPSP